MPPTRELPNALVETKPGRWHDQTPPQPAPLGTQNMKATALFVLILGLFHAPDCAAQRPAQNPMSPKRWSPADLGYELVWQDQFDGDALDSTKWEVRGTGPRGLGFVS